PLTKRALPGFASAMNRIANVRVRFRATIGGNIMARRKRYEATLVLLAARARLAFLGKEGMTELSVEEYLKGGEPAHPLPTHIELAAEGWLDFQYDRSLRPVMTIAFSAWRTAGGISGQAVIATEFLDPVVLPLERMSDRTGLHGPEEVAHRAFMNLPEGF